MRYIKLPMPIEAVQFSQEDGEDWDDAFDRIAEFTDDAVIWTVDDMTGEDRFKVYDYLHDVWVPFEREDWILKGVQEEFYPCKTDVFNDTYEEYDE